MTRLLEETLAFLPFCNRLGSKRGTIRTNRLPAGMRVNLERRIQRLQGEFLKVRAEVLHIPASQYKALQAATYHIFTSSPIQETQSGKISIRCDVLKHMFDFYDQVTASRQYPSIEQTNRQARGIGNNISFWNRLRSICIQRPDSK